jgi:hypothetical protein
MMFVMAHILGIPFEELLTPMGAVMLVAIASLLPRKRRAH